MFSFFVSVWLKFFFLFTPFFALTMFLAMTQGYPDSKRRGLALKISGAVGALCFILFFFGNTVFSLFGITLDAFRIGAGALLFISAVGLVQAKPVSASPNPEDDIAVVPMAIPIIVGPATIGTLLVLGAEIPSSTQKLYGCLALLSAIACVGVLLLLGSYVERILGKTNINILSKVTGLVLASLAAQMIFTGIRSFLS